MEMLQVNCLVVFVCLGCLLPPINGATKTWKFNNDILDPQNWIGGKLSTNCKGVIFPKHLGSVASVFELFTDELILPLSGELEIRDGGFIQITENYSSCIHVKELQHRHWLSPDAWKYEENVAIPDAEKVPCVHDDVVFSSQAAVAVYYPEVSVSVNSIEIGGMNISNEQWQNFLGTEYGGEQFTMLELFEPSTISINSRACASKTGCTCHDSEETAYWVCDNMEKREEAPCFDPVLPSGHCSPICGGVVLVEPAGNFDLHHFQKLLPNYEGVDSYASKIIKKEKAFIQVVFVEREGYTEASAGAAKEFHGLLGGDKRHFRVKSAGVEVSGIRLPKGSAWATAFSIILGTFVAVSGIYFCIYLVYVGPLKDYDFSSRLPITQFSFGNLRPFLFAKFENREEGQVSMTASMISLEQAFDNPMFGTHRPSTSSAVVDVVIEAETHHTGTTEQPREEPSKGKEETTSENPAFAEMKYEQVEMEDIEEDSEE